jgi:phosphatidate cytidylyltransferase
MTDFNRRFVFALVAAPAFAYVLYAGGWIFGALMVVLVIAIQREMIRLLDSQGFRPNAVLTYAFGLTILSFSIWDYAIPALLVMLLAFVTAETLNREHRNLYRMMSTLYCSMYAPVAVLTMIALRHGESPYSGFFMLFLMYLMIWGNDTFAYFGGRFFGRHLMAPHLSPKKTWEGFAFGFLGAGAAFGLMFLFLGDSAPASVGQLWPLILLVSVFGPIGDLAESKVKRVAGAKDSSNLLPGHGGAWDRFDSALLVAPAVYLYIQLLPFF